MRSSALNARDYGTSRNRTKPGEVCRRSDYGRAFEEQYTVSPALRIQITEFNEVDGRLWKNNNK